TYGACSPVPSTFACLRLARGTNADRRFDGLEDRQIPGATAESPGQCGANLVARRVRIAIEKRLRGQQERRRAVAALRRAEIGEGVLQWMQLAVLRQSLDGANVAAVALLRQHETREHRLAIQVDGARTTFAELAAVLRAAEAQILAQDFEERLVRREGRFDLL